MLKKYKYLIFIVFITIFTLLNYYLSKEKPIRLNHQEKEYTKLSEKFINIKFPVFGISDLLNRNEDTTFVINGVVALFSKSGCNPCQLRELKNLKKLHSKFDAKINIKVIFWDFKNEIEILRLRKITDFSLPMYTIKNFNFNNLFIEKPFPKIFYINNQIIKEALIPIPNNDSFSDNFYRRIADDLNK